MTAKRSRGGAEIFERAFRNVSCLALTNQGHQIAHLVVDEHPDLSDASGTLGLVGAAGAGYFTVKGK